MYSYIKFKYHSLTDELIATYKQNYKTYELIVWDSGSSNANTLRCATRRDFTKF